MPARAGGCVPTCSCIVNLVSVTTSFCVTLFLTGLVLSFRLVPVLSFLFLSCLALRLVVLFSLIF